MSDPTYGGIAYNSGAGSGSKYSVMSGDGNHPVNYVTWFDTLRFANWLNNGQGNGDTESGAYILQAARPRRATPTRSRGKPARPFSSQRERVVQGRVLRRSNHGDKVDRRRTATTGSIRPAATRLPTASGPTATPNSANYNGGR